MGILPDPFLFWTMIPCELDRIVGTTTGCLHNISQNFQRIIPGYKFRTTSAYITDVRRELDPGRTALVIMRGEEGERAGPDREDIKGAEPMGFSFCSSLCFCRQQQVPMRQK